MNETLFFDFLKERNLTEDFNKFVETKQSSMKNLKYELSVMIGDADFWLDMSFVITKDDKAFLQKWVSDFDDYDEVFSTGYENSEKEWRGGMLKNLFQDADGRLEDSCLGTSYEVEPTNDEPGEGEGDFYDSLYNRLENSYEGFDEDLLNLFKKTSFYEYIENS
jgi:hypothetical protein